MPTLNNDCEEQQPISEASLNSAENENTCQTADQAGQKGLVNFQNKTLCTDS